ncbi:hypothetical protein L6164_013220 [Bauhinia variegata]|uniref:Uncharacterized protein n=1 Tax=Bauhinia variegata TaxID=167791 RepID=A0ACB9PHW3_BAUVA|nr:hypothetical protein L6164_013220 [Bauhinia variegata]
MLNHDEETEHGHKKRLIILVATILSASSGMFLLGSYYFCKVCRNMTAVDRGLKEDMDLPLFDMSIIATSTDNFSNKNKIGEGGFGRVYKGKLVNGQEIAVKRLSKSSKQGIDEFKNEVKLIAKLQHRNLVKLLGCCIQRQEKMLVYEYMLNASLDCFIFVAI